MTIPPEKNPNKVEEGDYTLNGDLFLNHARLIQDSAISWDVEFERGYFSTDVKALLGNLGFTKTQQQVPALVIPIYSVIDGKIANYQIRPDYPRIDRRKGKPVKYETIQNSRMCLDVHPRVYSAGSLKAPDVPLFITEGIRKGDAAVSHELCSINLIGVWNFRGTNEYGGKTILADWEYIALNGRKVYICFDSDCMEKREVYTALVRLSEFLKGRKAEVYFIYLPPGEGGTKMGLDDFIADRIRKWEAA